MPPTPTTSRVLVVVPAHDEHECIGGVVGDIVAIGLPCLVVDDGSRDATAAIARAHGADVITLGRHAGVGAALRVGFEHALRHGFDTVVRVDADGQHPVEACAVLLHAMAASGADMVVGSRFSAPTSYTVPLARRAGIGALAWSIRLRTGQAVTDPTSGLRVVRRPLLDALAASLPDHYLGDTYEATLQAVRAGYRVVEEPVTMRARQGGRSTAGWRTLGRGIAVLCRAPRFTLPPSSRAAPARLDDRLAQTPTRLPADSPTRATT